MFPEKFINAGLDYSTLEKWIPAPYFRRTFEMNGELKSAKIIICGLGFYELHVNGENITKGYLAPYRSNPDHYIYFDEYDITQKLQLGKNVAAMLLGNGMQNPMGGYIWEFDTAPWRSAPLVNYEIRLEYEDGRKEVIQADEQTKTISSPVVFNDLHYGEYYDARIEVPDWDQVDCDETMWKPAKPVKSPGGEPRIAHVEPLVVRNELEPVCVTECDGGYIYDFGVNTAGLCRLTVEDGKAGQKILLQHFETLVDGKPYFDNFKFNRCGRIDRFQEDIYYCSGKGREEYTPHFTYHGFRYVYVTGITREQAKKSLLTCLEINSDLRTIGKFTCSDDMANRIQKATVRSDYCNFYYFPTDCPQREKHGWTADVAISAEQMLLNITPERSFREWMLNVYKAMNKEGAIPGIIPTPGWGYEWGNGPAWDRVLVYVPYHTYKYRGDRRILEECAAPLKRYLTHLYRSLDENNLMEIGLGDYLQAKRLGSDCDTPLIVTDTIATVDIARKAEFIYDVLGMEEEKAYAITLKARVRKAFRKHLMDAGTLEIKGDTQTGYAMALYYEMVSEEEREKVFAHLIRTIEKEDEHINTGVLGGKVIFRVLSENGRSDLAYHMITRPDFPSYGNWIVRGATTLWESFFDEKDGMIQSLNHHFWGDVSAWFYYYPGGLRFNPTSRDIHHIDVKPHFLEALEHAKATHCAKDGEIAISWKRVGDVIELNIVVPEIYHGRIELPEGYVFEDGDVFKELKAGTYQLKKKQ